MFFTYDELNPISHLLNNRENNYTTQPSINSEPNMTFPSDYDGSSSSSAHFSTGNNNPITSMGLSFTPKKFILGQKINNIENWQHMEYSANFYKHIMSCIPFELDLNENQKAVLRKTIFEVVLGKTNVVEELPWINFMSSLKNLNPDVHSFIEDEFIAFVKHFDNTQNPILDPASVPLPPWYDSLDKT